MPVNTVLLALKLFGLLALYKFANNDELEAGAPTDDVVDDVAAAAVDVDVVPASGELVYC